MARLTEADAANWRMEEAAHYNGGKVFFAYLHRCVEQPRLSRFDKYLRATKSVVSTWRTDGTDAASLAEAIERLNTAPVFTADELAFLASLPEQFTSKREIWPDGTPWAIADSTRDKGAIEWQDGKCRITDAGRLALSKGETNASKGGQSE